MEFLLVAHMSPACVLVGFGRIGIFLAFEPKCEPIYITLLRYHTLPRFLKHMFSVLHHHHFYRLTKQRQSFKPFPITQQ